MSTTHLTPARRAALEVLAAHAGTPIPIKGGATTADPPVIGATSARWFVAEQWAEEGADGDGGRTCEITEEGLDAWRQLEPQGAPAAEGDGLEVFGGGDTPPDGAPPDGEVEYVGAFADIDTASTTTTISGACPRITRRLHHREILTVVVQLEVTNLAFPATKHGIARRQVGAIVDAFEISGATGRTLINELKQAHDPGPLPFGSKADAAIVDATIAGITDGSGIVVTPGDRAALGLAGGPGTAAVVFANGARVAWPDDFPDGTPRPRIHSLEPIPGGDPTELEEVTEVLDMDTGAPIPDDEPEAEAGA